MAYKTPILLITFNRPDHVRRVLTEIRKQQPTQLYVCQDGAREGNENDRIKVQEVREVIKELVDWPCELHTLYQEKNLGCGPGPATGISWFFENVDSGIVMEDDCLPHPDFFGYCEELLERYKDDERIMYISSTLYMDRWHCDGSYGFSHYMMTGAWASWSRAWKGFDLDLHHLDAKVLRKKCRKLLWSRSEYDWWYFKTKEIQEDKEKKSYWDYQMQIHLFDYEGIVIHPAVNLITNIGFDAEGTHTKSNYDGRGNKQSYAILPLIHPKEMKIDKALDYECFAQVRNKGVLGDLFQSLYFTMLFSNGFLLRLLKWYKRVFRHQTKINRHIYGA